MLKLFFFLCLFSLSVPYKILVVFPLAWKSHSILGNGYVRELLKDGHEVTYVTPFSLKSHPNLTQIQFVDDGLKKVEKMMTIEKVINGESNVDFSFLPLMVNTTSKLLASPEMQKIMRNPNTHFDLLILEWMFAEHTAGLSAALNTPFVWAASTEPGWMSLQLIDETRSPAYAPDFMSNNIPPFDFLTRVKELGTRLLFTYMKNIWSYSLDKAAYEKTFTPIFAEKGRELPPFEEVWMNASLMFGNAHISLGQPMALPQNYKAIGGYHIDPDYQPLPEDLQKLMDSSKDGVIYFSMGSQLKSKDLPEKIKKDILEVLGSLKQTVIWKFEENIPEAPKNVKILQWAPQQAILAHPNCRLFVTHGGLLSTIETVHYGIPIIGMPVFADQFANVKVAVAKGYAKEVMWSHNVGRDLKEAIDEILNDPKYEKKVKELSFVYHHRPVPPAQELKHWVRHVIETGGAPHLRSVALRTPFYQKYYLDLLAVILIALFVLNRVVKSMFCNKKQAKVKKN